MPKIHYGIHLNKFITLWITFLITGVRVHKHTMISLMLKINITCNISIKLEDCIKLTSMGIIYRLLQKMIVKKDIVRLKQRFKYPKLKHYLLGRVQDILKQNILTQIWNFNSSF